MTNTFEKQNGFSLIELMVVLTIVGIITTIAVPSYQSSIVRSARGEGMSEILDIMRAQENYFANNFAYTTDLRDLGFAAATHSAADNRYTITAVACTDLTLTQCISISGTAINAQVDDGNLVLNSQGLRTRGTNLNWNY